MEQDPDLAQARVFLDLLASHARALHREAEFTHRHNPTARAELAAELRTIERFADRLHRRFPETSPQPSK
jgi:hypothetical protein